MDERPATKIPSQWWGVKALQPALEMLRDNPDLCGQDIALALASEAPDAMRFLDAQIAFAHYMKYQMECDKAYADMVAQRAKDTKDRYERAKAAAIVTMQELKLTDRSYRAPAGTVWLNDLPGKVHVPDQTRVPPEYRIPQPDKLDIAGIGKALDADPKIDWATRGNGGVSLTILGARKKDIE